MVTFDPNAPRGCKLFNFKGATMPYVMVNQATGKDCEHFEERPQRNGEKEQDKEGKINLNDEKYWK
jgi:hypothetical protein